MKLGNLYKEGEPEPYIGKLIKIWETADKAKKVKVLWYFRPGEIRNFLEGCEVRWNELFLACGDEVGLANLNPLLFRLGRRGWLVVAGVLWPNQTFFALLFVF
ncbi:hypothetical protein Ahy_B03g065869 [Arachis hypogaea]|uniref:BAH domain-containing protein n=1 Tax=Arachis hypogaea TaxID=3818 RepID=A0A445A2K0_ARAHY|nr:hypothetical protein Ahy_B03g065869 [Arachis hypogaea]